MICRQLCHTYTSQNIYFVILLRTLINRHIQEHIHVALSFPKSISLTVSVNQYRLAHVENLVQEDKLACLLCTQAVADL